MRAAVVAICKDEAFYIKEWLAYHAVLGLQDFIVYDNESVDETSVILKSAQAISLTLHDWPTQPDVSPQLSAYNDALLRHGDAFDFMCFFDIDEFLLPANGISVHQILAGAPQSVGAIGINQCVFGSSGQLHREPGLVIERFQNCAETDYEEHVWVKSCCRPQCVDRINSPHVVELKSGVYAHADGSAIQFHELAFGDHKAPVAPINSSVLQLNHYMLKSREEFESKRNRGGGSGRTEQQRKARCDGGYFDNRDPWVNSTKDARAASFAPLVKKKIDEIWPDAAPGKAIY